MNVSMQSLPRYKAWDLIKNKGVFVGCFTFKVDGSIKDVEIVDVIDGKAISEWRENSVNLILLLSTGLFDSQKKEIWQGDIVKQDVQTEFGSMIELIGQVEWSPLGLWNIKFEYDGIINFNSNRSDPTIIGSIFTDAHLLKKQSVDKLAPNV